LNSELKIHIHYKHLLAILNLLIELIVSSPLLIISRFVWIH